jgi:hypothetical protein
MIRRACLATGSAQAAALLFAAALTFGSAAVGPGLAGQDAGLRGSWHARQYTLSDGGTHEVSGQIHFTESDWLVLFFVMDGDAAARGSAEGGRYTLDGDLLTFEHLHNLSVGNALEGLPASPLRMETRTGEGAWESTRIEIAEDRLTLFFPSGNQMTFVRGSPP